MQRPWKNAAYWSANHGLLSLLSYTPEDRQPRDGITHNELGPLPSITNKKYTLRSCLQPGLMEALPALEFLRTLACIKLA